MSALSLAQEAYSASASPLRTSRGTEYEAFARITAKIGSSAKSPKDNFATLAAALHENRQLWLLLATDVADKANQLPEELRAQIFYLAEFTQHHSAKVLAGEATAEILVEINTAVMKGLRAGGGAK